MNRLRTRITRANTLSVSVLFVLSLIFSFVPAQIVAAGQFSDRSLMVTSSQISDDTLDGANENVASIPGHPNNGTMVGHTYTFKPYTVSNLQSFIIEYCDGAFGYLDGTPNCPGSPAGFSSSAWNGGTAVVRVNGASPINYTVTTTGANYLKLVGASASAIAAQTDIITITFTPTATYHFVNPTSAYIGTGAGQHPTGTYFAHVSSFSDNNTTTLVDEGTVTNNVTNSISIYTRVQETLNFSVEGDEAHDGATDPGTACSPLSASGAIIMGDSNYALDSTVAYFGKSYFRLATNSSNGATVYYSGRTLTSGAGDTITAIGATRAANTPGTEQFGLAFDSTDATGGIYSGHASALTAIAAYNNSATGYAFDATSFTTPVALAASTGVVQCETGAVKYVANINGDTEAGIYTTKINYIVSPSY